MNLGDLQIHVKIIQNSFNVNLLVAMVHFFFKAVDNKFACVLLKRDALPST